LVLGPSRRWENRCGRGHQATAGEITWAHFVELGRGYDLAMTRVRRRGCVLHLAPGAEGALRDSATTRRVETSIAGLSRRPSQRGLGFLSWVAEAPLSIPQLQHSTASLPRYLSRPSECEEDQNMEAMLRRVKASLRVFHPSPLLSHHMHREASWQSRRATLNLRSEQDRGHAFRRLIIALSGVRKGWTFRQSPSLP
jgi:hypothetical protein